MGTEQIPVAFEPPTLDLRSLGRPNRFLALLKRKVIRDTGLTGDPLGYYTVPIRYAGRPLDLPFIYFINGSCSYDEAGACIECNYGRQTRFSDEDLIKGLTDHIRQFEGQPAIYLTPSGSLFDDIEVPERVRHEIFRQVRAARFEFFATECRSEFLTEKKLREARGLLGEDVEIEIGIGLESTNDWIRRNCINKMQSLDTFMNAVETCHRYKASVYAHVLIKPPFLNEFEAIEDAVETAAWALEHDVDRLGFALHNIKEGTITRWLAERGMYRPPTLWTIVRILLSLRAERLSQVGLFGFDSAVPIKQPAANCQRCTTSVDALLRTFCYTREPSYLHQAEEYPCSCKTAWLEDLRRSYSPLPQRVAWQYEELGRGLLGDEWWETNHAWVLAELQTE